MGGSPPTSTETEAATIDRMRTPVALLGGFSLSLFVACGGDSPDSADTSATGLTATSGVSEAGGDVSSSTSGPGMTGPVSDGTTTTSGDAPTTDDDVVFDLGAMPDAPPAEEGCAGIDFLFVIDNSGSMGAQQTQLLASFDGFITGIQDSLDDVDSFHVGVVTSDNYTSNAPGCQTLGDLVTQTQGGACGPFAEGNRFLTDADDIQTEFPCIGTVGTFGSGYEEPVSALIAAVSDEKAQPGACNENFIRDDSILVVVIVTDDPPVDGFFDDAEPSIDTSGWAPAVLAAKNDDPEAVVVIGFIPWQDVSCVPLTSESPNLINFVDAFGDQGIKVSVCEPDYGPVFQSTLDTIKTTCDNFSPQG